MKKNIKKQFIKIFKAKICCVHLILIALIFFVTYSLYDTFAKHFSYWQERPFFELEKIIISFMFTGVLTPFITILLNKKIQIYSKLKLNLYTFLIRYYWTSNSVILCKIIESFVNIIYKGDFIVIQGQTVILNEIQFRLKQISDTNSPTHVFIISGESHSGKTILSKKLLSNIFMQKEYLKIFKKYNRNIVYYDFSYSDIESDKIVNNYINNFYNDQFVIFDNIHKMADNQAKRLLQEVITESNKAIGVLILTRDINYLLTSQLMSDIDKRIESQTLRMANLSALRFDDNTYAFAHVR